MNNSLKFSDKLFRGSIFLISKQIIEFISGIGMLILLLRYFGPEKYGIYALVLSIIGIFGILSGNFELAIRRYLPEYLVKKK